MMAVQVVVQVLRLLVMVKNNVHTLLGVIPLMITCQRAFVEKNRSSKRQQLKLRVAWIKDSFFGDTN